MGGKQGTLARVGAQEGGVGGVQLQVWTAQCLWAQHSCCCGPTTESRTRPCPPHTPCYHVIDKTFVDRDEECLVGVLVIQEVQKLKTPRGGIGVTQ